MRKKKRPLKYYIGLGSRDKARLFKAEEKKYTASDYPEFFFLYGPYDTEVAANKDIKLLDIKIIWETAPARGRDMKW